MTSRREVGTSRRLPPLWADGACPRFVGLPCHDAIQEVRAVAVPSNDRPYMPGYGIKGPSEGTGLLPWAWATERLASARNYWLSTTTPAGAPHAMPVWAVWLDDRLWFSSSLGSRKIRNLTADPRCT